MTILQSQRWNFSSSTTRISASSRCHSLEDRLGKPSDRAHLKVAPNSKETVGEAFRRLSVALNQDAIFNQTFSKFSYMAPDSPLPLDSPGITMQIDKMSIPEEEDEVEITMQMDKRLSIPEDGEIEEDCEGGAGFACVVEREDGPSAAPEMGERRGTSINLLALPKMKRSASVSIEKTKLGDFLERLKNIGMVWYTVT